MKIFLGFLCIVSNTLFAQKLDSAFGALNEHFQPEKIHIHFDKSVYNKGETIWMKLYLLAGNDLSGNSKNVYVDWYTQGGDLLKHTSAPIIHSAAKMQFDIPDTYEGGSLRAVAYTRWMLNFDLSLLYRKEILVAKKLKPVTESTVSNIHFFPEGGNLINGLLSLVAFKANDQIGRPVKVTGVVKSASGDFVDSILTEHDGMGSFSIEPKKGISYTAYWIDEMGIEHISNLPTAKELGVSLELHPMQGRILFELKRTENAPMEMQKLHLTAVINQQLLYQSTINLIEKTTILSKIPTDNLPSGIMTVTVFDNNWIPLAERIVFVNNYQYTFQAVISFPERSSAKRGRNVLQIDVPDTLGASLSVAVTDSAIPSDSSNNIVSQFILSSDLKGYINNPAYYFSNTSDSVAGQLDLVMLTNGWRRYQWDEIIAGNLPKLKYQQETNYIRIRGTILGDTFKKSANKPALNVIISAKDSSRQIVSLPAEGDSVFAFNNSIFYDSLQLNYAFDNDKKLTEISEIHFQNGLIAVPPFSQDSIRQRPLLYQVSDSSAQIKIRKMLAENERLQQLRASTTLKEVVVKTKSKTNVQLLDDKFAKGIFSGGGNIYQFDIQNDQMAQSSPDILTYLQGRTPGLRYGHKSTEPAILTWRGSNTDLFVDETKTDITNVLNINMQDVAYIKIFPPIFYGSASGGNGGADAGNGSGHSLKTEWKNSVVSGYTPYKEFYSPDYSKTTSLDNTDIRETLYWNPNIITDSAHHTIRLPFFNTDRIQKLRIIMEGINSEGKLARVEKVIE